MMCKLCPDFKGCIVEVQTGDWYHISCVNLMPGMWFPSTPKPNIINVIEEIRDTTIVQGKVLKSQFDLTCRVCKIKKGACI
jgi:hypothetical protein